MLAEVGHPVSRLVRTRIGPVHLGGQRAGDAAAADPRRARRPAPAGRHRPLLEWRAWRYARSGGRSRSTHDDRDEILAGTSELVTEVLRRNGIDTDDLISIVFTATPDLTAEFPAYAARLLGLTDVPLLCTTEIAVPGAMPRVLRLMAHVETALSRAEIRHVYLRGAAALRTDLPHSPRPAALRAPGACPSSLGA